MPKLKNKVTGKVFNIVKKTPSVKLNPSPKKIYRPRNLA